MRELLALFKTLDGQSFNSYQRLLNKAFDHPLYHLRFIHIQGSPGAFPASVCHLGLTIAGLGLPDRCLSTKPRKMATADYLLRALRAGVATHARQNRGHQGSGSFQPLSLPPQVLERNIVSFEKETVQIAFHISLPGSADNRVLGRQATQMFAQELTGIVDTLNAWIANTAQLKRHCDVIEDMVVLQNELAQYGLMAFVGDGAILPRQSGVSQVPLKENAVAFYAPDQMAVEVEFKNTGRKRGLGIRPGVNVLIGGGFHGKSTLLDALVKGIYPHIPGDGREQVVTHPDAAFICAEDGRAITGLDISGFIDNLPGKVDAKRFWTTNASGSTSEAAAIIEAVLANAKLLLIDEDSSATNFLIKDRHMRRLIPIDTITPLFDRVQELYQRFEVSTLIVVGGSSEYLGVAEHVIAMKDYLPVYMTEKVRHLSLPEPKRPANPLRLSDNRRLGADNFNPSYRARRLGKTLPVRIKPLRLQEMVLEYGNEQLDLTKLTALVDPHQVIAVGYALLLARKTIKDQLVSPSDLAGVLDNLIENEGLSILSWRKGAPVFFARPRKLELAGAINRLRNLKVEN
ncbi:putative ABC transporter, ATP-binding protein [Desulfosarcina variabilis str. Montpellier]